MVPMVVKKQMSGMDWRAAWKLLSLIPEQRDDLVAVLNGAVGDTLESEGSSLAIQMTLFDRNGALDLKNLMVERPSSRIAIFVPGLMAGPNFWSYVGEPFPERIAADRGVTAIRVFYNTGMHVSTNGQQLAQMIHELVEAWPVEVTEISLVGHSMGGLVSRSATHYADQRQLPWVGLLQRMILLGTPLRGATLEQVANLTASILGWIPNPWTWVISWAFRQRSAGIKDLRHGYLVDEEWMDIDPDALTLGRQHIVPLLPHVEHFVAAGTLVADEHHPLAKIIGDALVAPYSAKDEGIDGTPTERAATAARVFPGVSHPGVAGDDVVYQQLLQWWPAQAVASVVSA